MSFAHGGRRQPRGRIAQAASRTDGSARTDGAAARPSRVARSFAEALEGRMLLSAGDPDFSFSGDGRATFGYPGAPFVINDVAVQSDGKVVVAGAKGGNFAVARLNADGSIDGSF